MFISKKKRGLYKDFGLVSKIWFYIFFNYIIILLRYNNITYLFLFEALFAFHARIIEFSEIYSQKDVVLPLTIDYYIEILFDNLLNSFVQSILQKWIDRFYTPDKTLYFIVFFSRLIPFRKRSAIIITPINICFRFNDKGCIDKIY